MTTLLNALSRASNAFSAALAPVDTDGGSLQAPPGLLAMGIHQLEGLVKTGSAITLSDIPAYIDAIRNVNGKGMDDRLFALEKLVTLMAYMPPDSDVNKKLQEFFIDTLYKDLPHPPESYLAPQPQIPLDQHPKRSYNYRSTNGDHYSPTFPNLGRAGMPYSRSVPSTSILPPSALPDPGLVFDLLLSRPAGKFTPHPGGLSSMFFGMANLVIHSIFDTNREDWNINDTSSYIDLSPLYGNTVSKMKRSPEEVRKLDGTGRLHEDVFGDSRLLFMPPTTAVLLVLLCRNHNFIAEKIFNINERGTYKKLTVLDDTTRRAQDDEIFERARLVNCGFFARMVLYDYVGGILGMTRDGSPFRLNLDMAIRQGDHGFSETGQGNQISAEFNILYRWHATTSAPDEQWIDGVFSKILDNKPYNEVTVDDFTKAAGKFMRPGPDVTKWEFGGLKRDPVTGRFNDAQLAAILKNATEVPAHAFGARKTPEAMRVVEIMTIMQGRAWGCCTLNEFRQFFGLKAYANFREWNSDPDVYNAAQALYGTIDNLELHVGLQAEESKPAMPGAGLCPSYTMSRAILADAVVLCRSDPYLATEFTPYNCTAWGYQDCIMNPKDGSYGGALTKLLLRTLPTEYASGDAYAHFAFLVPSGVQKAMTARRDPMVHKYNWLKPTGGTGMQNGSGPKALMLNEVSAANIRMSKLVGSAKIDRPLINNAILANVAQPKIDEVFASITAQLIRDGSVMRPGFNSKQIDIVQTVLNLVPVYYVANELLGLPIKNKANPAGIYRPEQLYEMFANAGSYVLYNQDAPDQWYMREKAEGTAKIAMSEIKANLDRLSYGIFSITGLVDTITDIFSAKTNHSDAFLSQLLAGSKKVNLSQDDLAASLFATVIPSVAQYSAALAQIIDFYLDEKQDAKKADLASMASAGSAMNAQILAYAKVPMQSSSSIPVLTPADTNGVTSKIGAGLPRDGLMSEKIFDKTAPIVLRAIFGLKNVRKAPGISGQLPQVTEMILGSPQTSFINNESGLSPWPTRLMIQYDA